MVLLRKLPWLLLIFLLCWGLLLPPGHQLRQLLLQTLRMLLCHTNFLTACVTCKCSTARMGSAHDVGAGGTKCERQHNAPASAEASL